MSIEQERMDAAVDTLRWLNETGTYLTLPALESIMPADEFNALQVEILQKTMEKYPYHDGLDMTKAEYGQAMDEIANGALFKIGVDKDGNLAIQSTPLNTVAKGFEYAIIKKDINVDELLKEAKSALEKHNESIMISQEQKANIAEALQVVNKAIEREQSRGENDWLDEVIAGMPLDKESDGDKPKESININRDENDYAI